MFFEVPNPCKGKDVIAFCSLQNDPRTRSIAIREGKAEGFEIGDKLQLLADQGEYVSVLKGVWAAVWRGDSFVKGLEWLRAHASLHAPLMCELALAEFKNTPTVETVHLLSLPLINAAGIRVAQDCQCSKDPSVFNGDSFQVIKMAYVSVLDNLVRERFKKSLGDLPVVNGAAEASKEKKLQILQLSLSRPLPNPEWTKWRGMGAYLLSMGESHAMDMHPAAKWQDIRAEFAKKLIAEFGCSQ